MATQTKHPVYDPAKISPEDFLRSVDFTNLELHDAYCDTNGNTPFPCNCVGLAVVEAIRDLLSRGTQR